MLNERGCDQELLPPEFNEHTLQKYFVLRCNPETCCRTILRVESLNTSVLKSESVETWSQYADAVGLGLHVREIAVESMIDPFEGLINTGNMGIGGKVLNVQDADHPLRPETFAADTLQ